ncbi:MAG: hypothetical protein PHH40_04485 [Candidatus Moranbacteria bacterium]|nr:hypothetical protein [Candidatus Moranbacteria bacterium]MDD3964506.1 hypothetical protein [Candidatus Moranbacteria bacterium]
MSLEDLNEKLHGRDVHLDRTVQHTPFDPEHVSEDSSIKEQFQEKEVWQAPLKPTDPVQTLQSVKNNKWTRKISFILGGLAIIFLLGGTVYKFRTLLFSENQVNITISGPKDVPSSEETAFTLTYTNNNWSALNNVSILLSYPETFFPQADSTLRVEGRSAEIILGEIPSRTEKQIVVKGKFYESKGKTVNLQAVLRYSPKRISSVLEKKSVFPVTVASSPLLFEIMAPLESVSGQDAEYVIDYKNTSDKQFSDVRMKLVYPEGFRFSSADPRPSEGESVWYIGNLPVNSAGKIVVRGVLTGTQKEYKTIQGSIGFFRGDGTFVAYGSHERQTQMIASPLLLSQTVNNLTDISVGPGDILQYTIRYKNTGDIGLRDAIVWVEIDPTLLDLSSLKIQGGTYDASRRMIFWKASDIPSLGKIEVGAGGSVSFTIPVSRTFSSASGKNLVIKTVAKIDSLDIPTTLGSNKIIGSNTLLVKIKSFADVIGNVLYTDAVFPNTGPVPPVVGQETSYTIHLKPTNTQNDLKNARITISLPTGVVYKNQYAPSKETFTYNERSNELVWELGTLSSTEGNARELVFQIATTPAPYQAGRMLSLLNTMILTATDTFTGQEIRVEKTDKSLVTSADPVFGTSFLTVAVP